jgi:hypothetical protein
MGTSVHATDIKEFCICVHFEHSLDLMSFVTALLAHLARREPMRDGETRLSTLTLPTWPPPLGLV